MTCGQASRGRLRLNYRLQGERGGIGRGGEGGGGETKDGKKSLKEGKE